MSRACCAVEVDNENSLLSLWLEGKLKDLPPTYAAKLGEGWNAWLRAKYPVAGEFCARLHRKRHAGFGRRNCCCPPITSRPRRRPSPRRPLRLTNSSGRTATVLPITPDGSSMTLTPAAPTLNVWKLNLAGGSAGTLSRDNMGGPAVSGIVQPGLNAQLNVPGSVSWGVSDGARRFATGERASVYTFSFWARANAPRAVSVNLWEDKPPYRFLGLSQIASKLTDKTGSSSSSVSSRRARRRERCAWR